LSIVGKFNYDNACAAIDAVWYITNDINAIERGLYLFKGLPHRLQLVRELDNVKYYDDSIATIPGAAIAALKAFDNSKVIILGGSSKGSDFSELGKELKKHDVRAILIGDESEKIANSCRIAGFSDYEIMDNTTMVEIVKKAKSLSKKGGVVLLSPASASFGLFKNYSDRGDQFIDAVMKL
jgi:UDP-N-acetylmuramoylalanine--D-glutamate ligase